MPRAAIQWNGRKLCNCLKFGEQARPHTVKSKADYIRHQQRLRADRQQHPEFFTDSGGRRSGRTNQNGNTSNNIAPDPGDTSGLGGAVFPGADYAEVTGGAISGDPDMGTDMGMSDGIDYAGDDGHDWGTQMDGVEYSLISSDDRSGQAGYHGQQPERDTESTQPGPKKPRLHPTQPVQTATTRSAAMSTEITQNDTKRSHHAANDREQHKMEPPEPMIGIETGGYEGAKPHKHATVESDSDSDGFISDVSILNVSGPDISKGEVSIDGSDSDDSNDPMEFAFAHMEETHNTSDSEDDINAIGSDGNPQQHSDGPTNSQDDINQYRQPVMEMTIDELRELVFNDVIHRHYAPRSLVNEMRDYVFEYHDGDIKIRDIRTSRKKLREKTSFRAEYHDCCRKGCISYAPPEFAGLEACPTCKLPRYRPRRPSDKKPVAFSRAPYFPLTHRLKLMFSDKKMARIMRDYPQDALRRSRVVENKATRYVDWWSSGHYQHLITERGLFKDQRTVALSVATDGVKVFKTRAPFYCWPILITNLNLPPRIRFKRRNLIVAGFVPGPKNPIDLDSFLYPLVEELKTLDKGCIGPDQAYDSFMDEMFDMKAHLVVVSSDMVARSKLIKCKGNRGISYCEYCPIKALSFNRARFNCHHPPIDAPASVLALHDRRKNMPKEEHMPYYDFGKDYTYRMPGRRKDKDFRAIAKYIAEHGNPKFSKLHGITGQSVFVELSSISFPYSFPPCSMHLFFENTAPAITAHFRGKFFTKKVSAKDGGIATVDEEEIAAADTGLAHPVNSDRDGSDVEADDEKEHLRGMVGGNNSTRGKKTRKRQKKGRKSPEPASDVPANGSGKGKKAEQSKTDGPKFIATDDAYNVSPDSWIRNIGPNTEASNSTIPAEFCGTIRDFTIYCHQLKAANWKLWLVNQSPIYLKGELAEPHYSEYLNFVEGVRLACAFEVTAAQVQEIRARFMRFVAYYEKHYYQYAFKKLSACLPTMHQLRHVADSIEEMGPMFVYSQWACERVNGMMANSARSRVRPNENMAINLEVQESTNILPYIIPDNAKEKDFDIPDFLDTDGRPKIGRMLSRYHKMLTGEVPWADMEEQPSDAPGDGTDSDEFITDDDAAPIDIVHNAPFRRKIFTVVTDKVKHKKYTQPIASIQYSMLLDYLDRHSALDFDLSFEKSRIENDRRRETNDDIPTVIQEEYYRMIKASVIKWRSMKLQKGLVLGRYNIGISESRITSTEVKSANKTRASWFVEYGYDEDVDDYKRKSLKRKQRGVAGVEPPIVHIGEILFFIQVSIPIVSVSDEDKIEIEMTTDKDGREKCESRDHFLAYIKEIPVDHVPIGGNLDSTIKLPDKFPSLGDPFFLYKRGTGTRREGRKKFIMTGNIMRMVGFMKAEDGEYVSWKTRCYRRNGDGEESLMSKRWFNE